MLPQVKLEFCFFNKNMDKQAAKIALQPKLDKFQISLQVY